MILALFRVMLLSMLRDRGAFAMAFVLPPLIYVIFATIFSVTAGGDLRVKVAIVDQVASEASKRLVSALSKSDDIQVVAATIPNEQELERLVRRTAIDAGILIKADPADLDRKQTPIKILGDAGRAIAIPIVTGHILRVFGANLPDVTFRQSAADIEQQVGDFSDEQRKRRDVVAGELKQEGEGEGPKAGSLRDMLIESVTIKQRSIASPAVVYYAGAVAFMFLMFAAAQSAMSLIEERDSGIVDRIVAGTGGVLTIVAGKFAFLFLQGTVQATLIFTIASVAYGVELRPHLAGWAVITASAAACAASLGLMVASLCGTRQQAATLSNFMVLVLSAIGGSMVPRFLMPPWLQDLSWITPNAWAVEAYHRLLWQGAPIKEALAPALVMAGAALVGLAISTIALRISTRA